jgi:hypothetical protein
MCCFSGPVKSVSATNIFARMGEAGRQFVVYSMTVNMAKPLAMVLPLPVKKGSDEKSVRFIDLENYQNFFDDLDTGFPKPVTKLDSMQNESMPLSASARILEVVQVGNFEASFVPTVKDFNRLDSRFKLPTELFAKMPDYKHFGFAVFKLKPGSQTVHPMAFEFSTAHEKLFFPTVHIHDGKVHARAKFDHILYCQPSDAARLKLSDWQESDRHASRFVDVKKSAGIVAADEHCYKFEMHGLLANKDTFVEISA